MEYIAVILVCFFVFSSSTCKKEGDDCHHYIEVKNISNKTVIFALLGYKDTLCFLSKRQEIASNEEAYLDLKYCWEDELKDGRTQDIYIVDTSNFNAPNTYYSCDSIELKNTVLKHFVLSLEDLRNSNFTISYP